MISNGGYDGYTNAMIFFNKKMKEKDFAIKSKKKRKEKNLN